MAQVKASEIVTPDKKSGTGPATVKLVAGANPIAEERTAVLRVVSGQYTKNVNIRQETGGQVVVIPEFDYLVLRYSWEAEDGTDFDTATGFVNTGSSAIDNKYVGWSKNYTTTSQNINDYIVHGGDNMQSGKEAALINMKALLSAIPEGGDPDVKAVIYGNWYESKGRGDVVVSFTAYLGGEMEKGDFNFINKDGAEVYTDQVTTNVAASGNDNYQNITGLYTKIGTMVYNKEKRDCVIIVN